MIIEKRWDVPETPTLPSASQGTEQNHGRQSLKWKKKKVECYKILHGLCKCLFVTFRTLFSVKKIWHYYVFLQILLAWKHHCYPSSASPFPWLGHTWFPAPAPDPLIISLTRVCGRFHSASMHRASLSSHFHSSFQSACHNHHGLIVLIYTKGLCDIALFHSGSTPPINNCIWQQAKRTLVCDNKS